MKEELIGNKIDLLMSLLPEGKPIGITFATTNKKYYYDTTTGKILECGDIEYQIIGKILANDRKNLGNVIGNQEEYCVALDNVIAAIQKENVLRLSQFTRLDIQDDYKDMLNTRMNQLVIELTERCNLRCGYCIYSEDCSKSRNFGERDTTEDVAFRAIDYAYEHSTASDDLYITFYGGEPLIRYDIMKKCLKYATEKNKNKKLYFSFTTNTVLMTEEIAKELAQYENFGVLVSIDGPREVHDLYRVDVSGKGTFDRALRGLRHLVEAFGERAEESIILSMVYGPPYSYEKLEKIQNFFEGLDWLPSGIRKQITYPTPESMPSIYRHLNSVGISAVSESDASLLTWTRNNYNKESRAGLFTSDLLEQKFLKINKRLVFDGIMDYICLNGCCMPGQRRLYVTVDGKFRACERVGNSPFIGDLENGLYMDTIEKEYLFGYAEKSYEKCSKCWLGRLCDVCYAHCFDDDGLNIEKKNKECYERLQSFKNALIMYFEFLEIDPHMFDFLTDYIMI